MLTRILIVVSLFAAVGAAVHLRIDSLSSSTPEWRAVYSAPSHPRGAVAEKGLSAVSPNQPILESGITGPGQRAALSVTLGEGMRAVTMRVNDVLGVAGFVLPGDKVDVMLTRSRDGSPYVDVLLQGLKVLALDQLSSDKADKPTVFWSVTFEVNTVQAQKLALGAQVGQLSLHLSNIPHSSRDAVRRITVEDLAPPEIQAAPRRLEVYPGQIRDVFPQSCVGKAVFNCY